MRRDVLDRVFSASFTLAGKAGGKAKPLKVRRAGMRWLGGEAVVGSGARLGAATEGRARPFRRGSIFSAVLFRDPRSPVCPRRVVQKPKANDKNYDDDDLEFLKKKKEEQAALKKAREDLLKGKKK